MKTPDEIKKGLELCGALDGDCENCAYDDGRQSFCGDRLRKDALAYIRQLESSLEQVKRERDAAVRELEIAEDCYTCKQNENCKHDGIGHRSCRECGECPCSKCESGESQYEWRGPCPENTPDTAKE